jgi:hypothetical protein
MQPLAPLPLHLLLLQLLLLLQVHRVDHWHHQRLLG